ncbi:MAG: hypothetical protein EOM58_07995 [Clostridia bacterium]|nr:hypothetical protein [Clostridia bacterium]
MHDIYKIYKCEPDEMTRSGCLVLFNTHQLTDAEATEILREYFVRKDNSILSGIMWDYICHILHTMKDHELIAWYLKRSEENG